METIGKPQTGILQTRAYTTELQRREAPILVEFSLRGLRNPVGFGLDSIR